TQILADEKMRRLRAGVHSNLAVDNGRSETVDVMNRDAVVAPLPGFSAVRARVNRAEECTGEHRAAVGLEDDRADVIAAQRAPGFPPTTVVGALEKHRSVLGCRPKLARRVCRRINVGSAVG